jgi:arylsulfatase A-like enzyme
MTHNLRVFTALVLAPSAALHAVDVPNHHESRNAIRRIAAALLMGWTVAAAPLSAAAPADPAAVQRPNMLVIVADDLGWGHVGWQNPKVQTPHLDRLANEGVKLDRHYVAPVCSPTRVAFMTGRYWSRFGVNGPLPSEPESKARAMPPGTETIASSLQAAGYRTALIGKWHLGASIEDGPERFGFEYFYGLRVGGMTPLTHKWLGVGESVLWRNADTIQENGHATDLFAREAAQWIDGTDDGPFFLYLAFTSPHVPLQEPDRWMGLYKEVAPDLSHQLYWASISHLDDAVGQVMAAVERRGQRDNTLVVFFGDNGAPGQRNLMQVKADHAAYLDVTLPGGNLPFRGKKGDLYEGGIRTPAFASWPARLRPGTCTLPLHVTDWMPTLRGIADHRLDGDFRWDGQDILPILTGSDPQAGSRTIYAKGTQRDQSLIQDDWKLIVRPNKFELFHLTDAPGETADLAAEKPNIVQRLKTLLDAETANDGDATPRTQPPKADLQGAR